MNRGKPKVLPNDRATRRVIAPFVNIRRKSNRPEYTKVGNKYCKREELKSNQVMPSPAMLSFDAEDEEFRQLLFDTIQSLRYSTRSTGMCLYIVDPRYEELYVFSPETTARSSRTTRLNFKIQSGYTIAAYVAATLDYIMMEGITPDDRFPMGIGYPDETIKSVMCVPVITPKDECFAVIELYKDSNSTPFTKQELELTRNIADWVGYAVYHNHEQLLITHQQCINDYLVNLTKYYFSTCLCLEKIIGEIMRFAKTQLTAERGVFFAIDPDSEKKLATVFNEGIDDTNLFHKKTIKIRLSNINTIPGLVAQKQSTLNLRDAYNDPRFARDVEKKTGFIARSVLCVPVLNVNNEILGVVQITNKKDALKFSDRDEQLMETICSYLGLILHYANLEKKNMQIACLNESTQQLIALQIGPCHHDIEGFNNEDIHVLPNFYEFSWYITMEHYHLMPQYCFYMMESMFTKELLHLDVLPSYILTIQKLYRNIPYHNFEHGFNVMHCMFLILSKNKDLFSRTERIAMLTATLCHDLDHLGYSNHFLQLTDHTLAKLYDSSPLEEHHYQMTLLVLEKYKIFNNLPAEEYKEIIKSMRPLIIATDLSNHIKLRMTLAEKSFDDSSWDDPANRPIMKSIIMVSCDLSGSCKPYPVAKLLAENLYKEFYQQGDEEKAMGLTPLSQMDRDKGNSMPEEQVSFLTVVVIPCMELLEEILPNTKDLYDGAYLLRQNWIEIIELRGVQTWRQEDSVVSKHKKSI